MRAINLIVVHCSATPASRDIGVAEIRAMHKRQGWKDVGYHFVIRRDGRVETGRPLSIAGAHVAGHNAKSIGICLVGGVKPDLKAETNFTPAQYASLEKVLSEMAADYPKARICGHRDLSPDRNGNGKVERGEWVKECPTFDVAAWWSGRQGGVV